MRKPSGVLILFLSLPLGLATVAMAARQTSAHAPETPTVSAADAAGHRLWVLLFDLSSMEATDVPRARTAATHWVDGSVVNDDLVSIVSVTTSLKLIQNFTPDVDRLRAAIGGLVPAPEFGTLAPGANGTPSLQERDEFNNDLRFRGLRDLCGGLQAIDQKKAIMLFTAVRARPGTDNQVEIRAATDACNRARASVNPIDVRTAR